MVKTAIDNTMNWFKVAWPVLTFVVSLSIGGMVAFNSLKNELTTHIAASNEQYLNTVKELTRIDSTGTQGLQTLKDRMTVVETKGDQYRLDIVEVKGNIAGMRKDLTEVMSDTKIMKDYVLRTNTQ